ncbi:hypothetical protein GCM10027026_28840 [Myroides odoratimimus subsp. xuanwuensis]
MPQAVSRLLVSTTTPASASPDRLRGVFLRLRPSDRPEGWGFVMELLPFPSQARVAHVTRLVRSGQYVHPVER